MNPQVDPSHVGVAFAGGVQAMHDPPHVAVSVLLAHALPHAWKPVLHEKPHTVPSHADAPFAGAKHGVQSPPQFETSVLLTHIPPQRWNPVLQTNPQLTPSHVAVAFAGGAAHGVQVIPHAARLVLLMQTPAHE